MKYFIVLAFGLYLGWSINNVTRNINQELSQSTVAGIYLKVHAIVDKVKFVFLDTKLANNYVDSSYAELPTESFYDTFPGERLYSVEDIMKNPVTEVPNQDFIGEEPVYSKPAFKEPGYVEKAKEQIVRVMPKSRSEEQGLSKKERLKNIMDRVKDDFSKCGISLCK